EHYIGISISSAIVGKHNRIARTSKRTSSIRQCIGSVVERDFYRHSHAFADGNGVGNIPISCSSTKGGRRRRNSRSQTSGIGSIPKQVLSYGLQRQRYSILTIIKRRGNGRRRRLRHYLHGYGHSITFASSIYLRYIVSERT